VHILDFLLTLKINISVMKGHIRIGVDTGGTFTDFVISERGNILIKKVLSTPSNPSQVIIQGIRECLKHSDSLIIVHGTTVATNALLERKGKRTALITTKGFEDVLSIGRQTRKNLYSLKGEQSRSLIPRNLCFGLDERTSSAGNVEKKVSLQELGDVLRKIRNLKVEAIAVSLLHSYANAENENIIKQKLKREGILYCLSSDILPEYREYERSSVTAVNAYLMPIVNSYLTVLEEDTKGARLRIMQSNEGHISPSSARREPIRTALSGPAGGVIGASALAKSAGFRNIITFDMGGTSSDVSLVDREIRRTNEIAVGDFPIRLPIIDIHTVGSGGGSIAYLDRGGSLRVGPQSAGANPGPACYGRGKSPTVTDANLVLGRLVPEFFLGGRMEIFPGRSHHALKTLAHKIQKSVQETAAGIIRIANANMEKAIRVISIERGFDPRNFTLFSFGGAGGMHAVALASQLRIPRVVVPKNAGVLSALGLLMADSVRDFSRSLLKSTEHISEEELESQFSVLEKTGLDQMHGEGFPLKDIKIIRQLDLRYLGQSYEITLPFSAKKGISRNLVRDFHRAHQKHYSYYHPSRAVEIVHIRIKVVGTSERIKLKKHPSGDEHPGNAFIMSQALYHGGREYMAQVFNRDLLEAGDSLSGPAVVVDAESTTFIPPCYSAEIDPYLNLIIQQGKRSL
jgi:N-methylhydantoinase A/oxoprolinase/acetone carboxylase beta subunit